MLSPPPLHLPITENGGQITREWSLWIVEAHRHISGIQGADTTAMRPVNGVQDGDMYFDTTLGQPVWWHGSQWVDATGSAA